MAKNEIIQVRDAGGAVLGYQCPTCARERTCEPLEGQEIKYLPSKEGDGERCYTCGETITA